MGSVRLKHAWTNLCVSQRGGPQLFSVFPLFIIIYVLVYVCLTKIIFCVIISYVLLCDTLHRSFKLKKYQNYKYNNEYNYAYLKLSIKTRNYTN